RAMRSPALRAWQSAPDPKICISYGACGNSGGIFHDLYCVWGGNFYPYSCKPEDVWAALEKDRENLFFIDVQARGAYPAYSAR
ncbi:hypothetical protein MMS56_29285, partial [Escherichia coli]|nr:hypothetical protein [Escherichia coli]